MKIRRFYSKNMRSALRQVTEEFGEDAAILSSRKTPSGVEVIAAFDYDEDLLPSKFSASKSSVDGENQNSINPDLNKLLHQDAHNPLLIEDKDSTNGQSLEKIADPHTKNQFDSAHQRIKDEKDDDGLAGKNNRLNVANLEWTTDPGLVAMREELGLMRSMMSEQLKGIGWERFSEKEHF
ncbi:MAG: hypothetical protein COB88_08580 [Flavobacteriales bacterium]|nr:MAG: hypothetical protein COB88_08580 [Flavobacteriales bacterium]